ncbi:MAG: hypothetical protein ACK5VF_09875, partial [Bacteroidota bacterium]
MRLFNFTSTDPYLLFFGVLLYQQTCSNTGDLTGDDSSVFTDCKFHLSLMKQFIAVISCCCLFFVAASQEKNAALDAN